MPRRSDAMPTMFFYLYWRALRSRAVRSRAAPRGTPRKCGSMLLCCCMLVTLPTFPGTRG
jgi:hypothetical protein